MFHKALSVKTLPGHMLWVEFRDGAECVYDMQNAVKAYSGFQELLNDTDLYSTVKVDAGGYGISWSDDFDLSSEELWNNGIQIKQPTVLSPGCKCPACGQKIREKSFRQVAASRANLAKRTHKGGRPVNPNSKRQQRLAQKGSPC